MFRIRVVFSTTLLLAASLSSLQMNAQTKKPIRGASGNGVDSNSNTWNLLGRTAPKVLTAGTKKVTFTRQFICIDQDVEDAFPNPNPLLTGTCDQGNYLYLFQFTSASANVKITIAQLKNFVPDNTPPFLINNWGVMICDPSASNTTEICTTDPNDPNQNNLPAITAVGAANKTSVTFTVSNFPTYPVGVGKEGQGLTLYVLSKQPSGSPVQLLQVGIQ